MNPPAYTDGFIRLNYQSYNKGTRPNAAAATSSTTPNSKATSAGHNSSQTTHSTTSSSSSNTITSGGSSQPIATTSTTESAQVNYFGKLDALRTAMSRLTEARRTRKSLPSHRPGSSISFSLREKDDIPLIHDLVNALDAALNSYDDLVKGFIWSCVVKPMECPTASEPSPAKAVVQQYSDLSSNDQFHMWLVLSLCQPDSLHASLKNALASKQLVSDALLRTNAKVTQNALSPANLFLKADFVDALLDLVHRIHHDKDDNNSAGSKEAPTQFELLVDTIRPLTLFDMLPQPVTLERIDTAQQKTPLVYQRAIRRRRGLAANEHKARTNEPPQPRELEEKAVQTDDIVDWKANGNSSPLVSSEQPAAAQSGSQESSSSPKAAAVCSRGVNTTQPSSFMTFAELLVAQDDVERQKHEVRAAHAAVKEEQEKVQALHQDYAEKLDMLVTVLRSTKKIYNELVVGGHEMMELCHIITPNDVDPRIPLLFGILQGEYAPPLDGKPKRMSSLSLPNPANEPARVTRSSSPAPAPSPDSQEAVVVLVGSSTKSSEKPDTPNQRQIRLKQLILDTSMSVRSLSASSFTPQPMIPVDGCVFTCDVPKQVDRDRQLQIQHYQCTSCQCQLSLDPRVGEENGRGTRRSFSSMRSNSTSTTSLDEEMGGQVNGRGIGGGGGVMSAALSNALNPVHAIRVAVERTQQNILHIQKPRRCHYCCGLYCHSCHKNRLSYLPFSVFSVFDFTPRHVCDRDNQFLTRNYGRAFLHWGFLVEQKLHTRPSLQLCAVLRKMFFLYSRLIAMCTHSCQMSPLLKGVLHSIHFATDEFFYSFQDLNALKASEENIQWSKQLEAAVCASAATAAAAGPATAAQHTVLPGGIYYIGDTYHRVCYLLPASLATTLHPFRNAMPASYPTKSTPESSRPEEKGYTSNGWFVTSANNKDSAAPDVSEAPSSGRGKKPLTQWLPFPRIRQSLLPHRSSSSSQDSPTSRTSPLQLTSSPPTGQQKGSKLTAAPSSVKSSEYSAIAGLLSNPNADLLSFLVAAVVLMERHVRHECPICSAKTSVLCDICKDQSQRLFLLDGVATFNLDQSVESVLNGECDRNGSDRRRADGSVACSVCKSCGALYHVACLRDNSCPRCS